MPNIASELSVYPCREDGTGKWFCEVTVRETGTTLFISDPRGSRASAIRRAQKQIEAIVSEVERMRNSGVVAQPTNARPARIK
jgi:hypothetical protein